MIRQDLPDGRFSPERCLGPSLRAYERCGSRGTRILSTKLGYFLDRNAGVAFSGKPAPKIPGQWWRR